METTETERPESDGPKPYTALSLLSAVGCGLVALNLFDQSPYRINPEPGVFAYLVLAFLAIWPLRWLWLCRKVVLYIIRDLRNLPFTLIAGLLALMLLLLKLVLWLVCVVLFFSAISSLSPLGFLLCLILWAVIAGVSGIESAIRSQGRNQYTE